MAGKVYTVQFDNTNVKYSIGSKASKVQKKESEKEVENYGIVEINNNSAKKKIKSTKVAGFEKNVTGAEKKAVKSNIAQIDDYFDFSFRPCAKVETKTETKAAKKVTAKKSCAKKAVKETAQNSEIIDHAKACEAYIMSEEVRRIISVARAGSLFG